MSFTSVPASLFASAFENAGFTRTVVNREVVYVRAHHKNPNLKIMVYTSVTDGAQVCREVGSDAIRACLVFNNGKDKTRGLGKEKRVNRTGTAEEIVERALERARSVYATANDWAKHGQCSCCGAPVWADSKRCYVKCAGSQKPSVPASVVATQWEGTKLKTGGRYVGD